MVAFYDSRDFVVPRTMSLIELMLALKVQLRDSSPHLKTTTFHHEGLAGKDVDHFNFTTRSSHDREKTYYVRRPTPYLVNVKTIADINGIDLCHKECKDCRYGSLVLMTNVWKSIETCISKCYKTAVPTKASTVAADSPGPSQLLPSSSTKRDGAKVEERLPVFLNTNDMLRMVLQSPEDLHTLLVAATRLRGGEGWGGGEGEPERKEEENETGGITARLGLLGRKTCIVLIMLFSLLMLPYLAL